MATTGFWPVKGRLKDVVNYAENPDKTTGRRFLDDDLAATLNYVENSDKTDQTMYVSGINCPKKQAYEQMMTTKRRFGKLGGNVAYHGYQSFQSGEVTPEEAHRIGIETAKRMWGDDYEIVVTTHVESSKTLIKDLNDQYDEIMSWSSLYDSAPTEAKKMVVNSMIKRVDVYRNYDLNIELNMNIRQFFLGMEETENIPITA